MKVVMEAERVVAGSYLPLRPESMACSPDEVMDIRSGSRRSMVRSSSMTKQVQPVLPYRCLLVSVKIPMAVMLLLRFWSLSVAALAAACGIRHWLMGLLTACYLSGKTLPWMGKEEGYPSMSMLIS